METWRLPGHTQSLVFDVLSRLQLSQEDWGKIMGAMFIAATYVAVREAVQNAGPHAMKGAFKWFDHPIAHESLPSQPWREALAAPAKELLEKGEQLPPASLALCAWCAPLETIHQRLSASRKDVGQLAEQPLENLPLPFRVPTAFLLVTLGLRTPDRGGTKLILAGFFTVHDALARTIYSPESWSMLSPELPYLGVWDDWDRCEKLRQAVRKWLLSYAGSGQPLLDAATTPEFRGVAQRTLKAVKKDAEFLD